MTHSTFYTAAGDHGDTARLGRDARLSKSSPLFAAVGAVDEATAAIGMARALAEDTVLNATLRTVQEHFIRLMAHLAATPEVRARYPGLCEDDLAWLEARLADFEAGLPSPRAFVLPGDSLPGAALHVARTAVRRAERCVVALAEAEPDIGATNLAYLNRLSSLLFVAALRVDRLIYQTHSKVTLFPSAD